MNFVSLYLLQSASPAGSALPAYLFQIAAIAMIVYFLMIRPQQRQRKQHEERLRSLKRGDQVVTAGGIVGEIVHIKDAPTSDAKDAKVLDDHITIKSAESRLVIERGRIARVLGEGGSTGSGA